MKFAGTLAPHPQPKFGISGRVAIADADSFVNGVTPAKISRSPAWPRALFFPQA
jgi:hypothetical protein